LEICIQFDETGQHIRKWSRVPFVGGECLYAHPAALSSSISNAPTDSGEVIQADREAAASLIEAYWSGSDESMMKLAKSYRAGHSQGVFARAFRDHRLAFSRPEPVGDEALVERVARAMAPSVFEPFDVKTHGSPTNRLAAQRMWLRLARAAIQAIPAPATDAGQSADSGMAFTAMVGDHCPGQRIDSIDEFLRLINGGAKLFDVRLASLPKSPSAGEEA
jgi:hypothetical protein